MSRQWFEWSKAAVARLILSPSAPCVAEVNQSFTPPNSFFAGACSLRAPALFLEADVVKALWEVGTLPRRQACHHRDSFRLCENATIVAINCPPRTISRFTTKVTILQPFISARCKPQGCIARDYPTI